MANEFELLRLRYRGQQEVASRRGEDVYLRNSLNAKESVGERLVKSAQKLIKDYFHLAKGEPLQSGCSTLLTRDNDTDLEMEAGQVPMFKDVVLYVTEKAPCNTLNDLLLYFLEQIMDLATPRTDVANRLSPDLITLADAQVELFFTDPPKSSSGIRISVNIAGYSMTLPSKFESNLYDTPKIKADETITGYITGVLLSNKKALILNEEGGNEIVFSFTKEDRKQLIGALSLSGIHKVTIVIAHQKNGQRCIKHLDPGTITLPEHFELEPQSDK